jgi:glycosyltransferase involved in cell wall biosynthesis
MKKISELITIVIPCKNEEKYIGKTLSSISGQLGVDGIRVIVADANSTDRTREIIGECQKKLNKLNIEIIEGGPVSVGRNRGASLVETPYVLFIDADTELIEHDIISQAAFFTASYHLITCKTVSSSTSIKSKVIFRAFNFMRACLMVKPFCTGVFFLTSMDRFVHLGGFDETVTNSEDYLLSKKYRGFEFLIMNRRVTQDDRRFKNMGYFKFLKMLCLNYLNRNDLNHFRKNINYWQ